MRLDGRSYAEIAGVLGITKAAVFKAVTSGMARVELKIQEDTAKLREIELQRLDELWKTSYPVALAGGGGAIATCLKIVEMRSKLLGLDMPEKKNPNADEPMVLRVVYESKPPQKEELPSG